MSKYYEVETKLKTVNKTYKGLKATSIGHPEFKKYYDMFYDENGTKYVPKDIEKYLNDFVMALWFMDDGSINSRKNEKGRGLRICSLNFSYEDHIILQNAIKKSFNINTKIGAYKRNNKLYYYISFNKRNSHRLKDIIGKYVLPSMKYKLDLAD